jgi:hypothetical protein
MSKIKDFKFKLFGSTYSVSFVDVITLPNCEGFLYGYCDNICRSIKIATKDSDGKPFPIEEIKISLFHEISHAVLNTGGYVTEGSNEQLVEWLGRCMNSLLEQKVFNKL